MTRNTKLVYLFVFLTIFFAKVAQSYDNAHFYRAPLFYGEPRFDKDFLASFDFKIFGGTTSKAIAGCCNDICLLDIYGYHNMQYLGKNVPGKDLSKPSDLILHQLEQIPSRGNFGILSFAGRFRTFETLFNYQQNFTRGFFASVFVPLRSLEISCIRSKDISCNIDEICSLVPCPESEAANTYWQAFLNLFPDIMKRYGLVVGDFKERGLGDVSLALGYTINYEDADFLDFIDATIRFGVTLPTSKQRCEDHVFSLPLGYNGHTGIFGVFDVAFGLYDWATLGMHFDATWFNKRCKNLRVKTACEQSGLIKLAKENAQVRRGTMFNGGMHFKADHFIGGFSLIVGYSYSTKQKDELDCFRSPCIDCNIANSDCALQKWTMHTMHLFAEYDFTKDGWNYCLASTFFITLS